MPSRDSMTCYGHFTNIFAFLVLKNEYIFLLRYYGLEGKKVVLKHRDEVIKVWRRLKGERGKAGR